MWRSWCDDEYGSKRWLIIETCSGSSFFCDSLSRCWSAVSHLVWKQMIIITLMRISKMISIRIIMLMVKSPELAMTTIKRYEHSMEMMMNLWVCFSPFCDVLDRLVEVEEFEQNSSSFEEQDFLKSLFVEDFLRSSSSSSTRIQSAHDHNSYFKALCMNFRAVRASYAFHLIPPLSKMPSVVTILTLWRKFAVSPPRLIELLNFHRF